MKEKIVHLMKSEGLTSSRLAEILEIQPSGISHILSGRNKPRFDLLQKILRRFPQINPDWLLLDSPTMYREQFEPREATQNSQGSTAASPGVDLFGLGEILSPNSTPNFSGGEAGNLPQNSAQFSPQNLGEILPQNSGENRPEDRGNFTTQNHQNFPSNSAPIQSVIVLYTDGTFTTYRAR